MIWDGHWRLKALRVAAHIFAAGVIMLAVDASAQTGRNDFDHETFARKALSGHIRPLYADLSARADALGRSLGALCEKRESNDEAVKQGFGELVLAWSRTEHLHFGPIVDQNRFERMMYWPDRQRIGERQVAQILAARDPAALSRDELVKKSVAVQGLTALETLLYGKGSVALSADSPEARFACGYAGAIADNVAGIARDIVAEWADGGHFAALWLKPGEDNPLYKSGAGTTFEILKAFRSGVYNARDNKLLPSLGLKRIAIRGQLAPKSRPPFEQSGLALATIRSNVEGALDLYLNGGLTERLAAIEPAGAAELRTQIESAISEMRTLEPSGLAVFSQQDLMDRLAHAREPLAFALNDGAAVLAEMAGMGGLILGFSDDGD
jgi:predicted lipoprotein